MKYISILNPLVTGVCWQWHEEFRFLEGQDGINPWTEIKKMFKWKVSGLGGGSSKKAKNSQSQNNDKLNNAKILPNNANVALPASAAENNNSQHDQNEQAKNNKNNKEGNNKSPSKK